MGLLFYLGIITLFPWPVGQVYADEGVNIHGVRGGTPNRSLGLMTHLTGSSGGSHHSLDLSLYA